MINPEVESQPFGRALALVGNKFPLDDFAKLRLTELPDFETLLQWAGYLFELVHVLHPGHYQVSQVGPLEIVIYDPDFLGVFDRQVRARVGSHGIA